MTQFQVRNDDFANRVERSFARQGFMTTIGARLGRIEPGLTEIIVDASPALFQQHGFFHGGLIGTIADSAGGYACFTLLAASDSVLTVEYKLNFMAPAQGEKLLARGRVLRPGRNVTVCQSDIFAVNAGVEKHCATLLGTFMTIANRADSPVQKVAE